MSFWQKMKFMTVGLASIFEKEEISEEKLAEIKEKDTLNEMMTELAKLMPVLKEVLIDERDQIWLKKFDKQMVKKIIAVVGAGHVNGICELLENGMKI
jgi:pheromone shutdown protein TraB